MVLYMEEHQDYIVTQDEAGVRLDRFLANKESELSRSFIQKLISEGYITVGGLKTKSSYNVRANDMVRVRLSVLKPDDSLKAEEIPIDIVFEDDELIVVNKPAGMVVHPAAGISSGTLVNAVLTHLSTKDHDMKSSSDVSEWANKLDLSSVNPKRPGIVHRLDKGTSGLIVIAKTISAYYNLATQVKQRSVKRKYIALICGVPEKDVGTIIAPIGRSRRDRKKMAVTPISSRDAITHFSVMERYKGFSLVEVRLETGRTHQIRVHFAYIGHPVVGDPDYGGQNRAFKSNASQVVLNAIRRLSRQALHAQMLEFVHPKTGEYMEFSAPIPEDIQNVIDALRSIS